MSPEANEVTLCYVTTHQLTLVTLLNKCCMEICGDFFEFGYPGPLGSKKLPG